MRFGLFYEHQLPRPWNDGQELKLYQDALDQVELADRVGFDYVWEVEHYYPSLRSSARTRRRVSQDGPVVQVGTAPSPG